MSYFTNLEIINKCMQGCMQSFATRRSICVRSPKDALGQEAVGLVRRFVHLRACELQPSATNPNILA